MSVEDARGQKCLVVLPSELPSGRRDALAVERLIELMLEDPEQAAERWDELSFLHNPQA